MIFRRRDAELMREAETKWTEAGWHGADCKSLLGVSASRWLNFYGKEKGSNQN